MYVCSRLTEGNSGCWLLLAPLGLLAPTCARTADIMQAFSDYQRTGFGQWPWESDALAFPRERPRFAKHSDGTLVEKPLPAGAGAQ